MGLSVKAGNVRMQSNILDKFKRSGMREREREMSREDEEMERGLEGERGEVVKNAERCRESLGRRDVSAKENP